MVCINRKEVQQKGHHKISHSNRLQDKCKLMSYNFISGQGFSIVSSIAWNFVLPDQMVPSLPLHCQCLVFIIVFIISILHQLY